MTHSCNLAKGTSSDLPYFATSFHIELNNSCRSTKLCSCQEHKQEPIHNFVNIKNNGLKYFLDDQSMVKAYLSKVENFRTSTSTATKYIVHI